MTFMSFNIFATDIFLCLLCFCSHVNVCTFFVASASVVVKKSTVTWFHMYFHKQKPTNERKSGKTIHFTRGFRWNVMKTKTAFIPLFFGIIFELSKSVKTTHKCNQILLFINKLRLIKYTQKPLRYPKNKSKFYFLQKNCFSLVWL